MSLRVTSGVYKAIAHRWIYAISFKLFLEYRDYYGCTAIVP